MSVAEAPGAVVGQGSDHSATQRTLKAGESESDRKARYASLNQNSLREHDLRSAFKVHKVDEESASNTECDSVAGTTPVVTFKNLTVTSVKRNTVLLKGVSGQINGGLTGIMGPSGSGKSTLLNTLALRLDRGMSIAGQLRLNGREYGNSELKSISGYVMQDDLLNGHLTCEETLMYTTRLRCPQDTTHELRQIRVDKVLKTVGLDHARHTLVGTPMLKGISGGERKRLAVAMELLVEPLLLFLDEPTSGLDSVTALQLCRTLKSISEKCTVICTIHQPQARIFSLFDNLLLLQSGDISYIGPREDAVPHFEAIGYPLPPMTNPADHLLDSLALNRSASSHSLLNLEQGSFHIRTHRLPSVNLDVGKEQPNLPEKPRTSWWAQFCVIFERTMKEQYRRKNQILTQLLQTVIMAVLIGCAFLQIGDGQSSVKRRAPVLFFCVINQGVFSSLTAINSFPGERMLSLRERAAGTYYASSYFFAKVFAETLLQIPIPIVFAAIVYPLIGLQDVVSKWFIFASFMVLTNLAATSLSTMVSAICRTTDMSITVLPMLLEVCRLFGGFFLSPADLPSYFSWLDALSYVKYCFVAISINENDGLDLTCTEAQVSSGKCVFTTGEQFLETVGMNTWHIGTCAGVIVGYIVVCRFIAYQGVRHIKW